MSDFNRDDIGNYSWAPDKNAPDVIDLSGGISYHKPEKKKKKGVALVAIVVVACILLSAAAGFGGAYLANRFLPGQQETQNPSSSSTSKNGGYEKPSSITVVKAEDTDDDEEGEGNVSIVSSVTSKVAASVVEITTETVVSGTRFTQYITSGAGSGVIIAKEGYIITNNHVIDGADSIMVRMNDGTEFKAKLIGGDDTADIAIIKIDAGDKELTTAVIGNSDKLIVGETVVAIGNPLGKLGGTVTDGIISALDREIEVDGEKMILLQHNAAINPGNSGGGLFNAKGELVGIVNAGVQEVEGIGFAIPINDAYAAMSELLEYGYVRGRVYLGLSYIDILDAYNALYYGVNTFGVYVYASEFNTELKQGDRISAIDGKEVNSSSDIKAILASHKVGDVLKITVVRGGKVVDVMAECHEYVPDTKTVDFDS